ncbi:MAG: radical protein, partial [Planctomycetaceae bacterium]|nr:radical protein [Planctomycetaceae bacterium]
KGLEEHYEILIFSPKLANTLSDQGLVDAILDLDPWMVGFTSYLWNINRNLWVIERLKSRRPDLLTIVGGPEITADNDWILKSPVLDFASIGEGEQTFTETLSALIDSPLPTKAIPGLYVTSAAKKTVAAGGQTIPPAVPVDLFPLFRTPLPNLNVISSPYLEGILDAADDDMMLLETIRGCIFKCKFCYYPKSYDDLYFVSRDKIVANLQHAREHHAKEVVLLDPTLNQRKDFADFLRLLADCNPNKQFAYFGELRSEGINQEISELLAQANFTEVEIGLQSVDPLAQELMDRKNNMKAFERGVRAMRANGIRVKVDLIIGLPGDTVESIRRGMHYLKDSDLYDLVQVFNLAILPGTAFRQEAEALGLKFQPQPPYYVLQTPTLQTQDFYTLMAEAQEIFETEFDPLPDPVIPDLEVAPPAASLCHVWQLDFERPIAIQQELPSAGERAQAFTLWFQADDFLLHRTEMERCIDQCLTENPHTTLQIVLEPGSHPESVTPDLLIGLLRVSYRLSSYLDRFYSMAPGRRKGAKRLILLLPLEIRDELGEEWIDGVGDYADVVWQGTDEGSDEMAEFEYVMQGSSEFL